MSYKTGAEYIKLNNGSIVVKATESTSDVVNYKLIMGKYIGTIMREMDDTIDLDSVIDAIYNLRHGIGDKIKSDMTREEVDKIFVNNEIPKRFES